MLFIAHRTPFPPNKGDKIRSYNILKYLSARYTVDVAFLVEDVNDLQHLNELKEFASSIFYAVIPSYKKLTAAISAFSHRDPISTHYFYSKKLQESIDHYFHANLPSCVFCFSSPTAEYVFQSQYFVQLQESSHLLMDLIDLDSLKWSQYAQRSNPLMRQIYKREARLLARYEEQIARMFNSLLLVSEAEKQLCPQPVREKVAVVPNGVDLIKFFPDQGKGKLSDGPVIVFTGAMDYWPNVDAVTWFSKEIFSLILSQEPTVRFFIVGANPTPEVLALGRKKNIVVTGSVEDIREYIALADICVAPLRIARGIQNKVLEAMAMGKAVVATPQAIEGISAESSQQVMIANSVDAFAQAVVHLLRAKDARLLLGKRARNAMELHYSWEKNLSNLDAVLP